MPSSVAVALFLRLDDVSTFQNDYPFRAAVAYVTPTQARQILELHSTLTQMTGEVDGLMPRNLEARFTGVPTIYQEGNCSMDPGWSVSVMGGQGRMVVGGAPRASLRNI